MITSKYSFLATGGPRFKSQIKDRVFEEYKKISKEIFPPVRKSGSAALDLAYVAAGRYDGSWQRELNYWDIAAGIILVKESGGFIENIKGKEFIKDKLDIVASNSKIHKKLTELL